MEDKKRKILQIVEEVISRAGFFLVEIDFRGDSRNRIVEIYIDNEIGVTTKACAEISREIATLIDEGELITSKYRLDVSSPGVERPLKFIEQYSKHVNRKFELKIKEGEETKKLEALLLKIEGPELTFKSGKDEIIIKFENILSAKVIISF